MAQTLNLTQCKEYVRNIRDLELSCYQLEELQGKIKRKLGESGNLLPQNAPPKKPEKGSLVGDIVVSLIILAIAAGLGALIGGIFGNAGMGALILGGAVTLLWLLPSMLTRDKLYQKDLKEYEAKQAQWEKQDAGRREQNQKMQGRSAALQTALQQSGQKLNETRGILKQYYDMNFIYPKYRGLVPICTICEYLESGRCFSLIGPDGAYNLYESELRSNMVLSKLDDVIDRLDTLSAGQQMLADAIRQSNQRVQQLSSSLDRIEQNTAVSAYYSRVTAANTDYLSWLATFR